jgi:hypothetical protein
MSIVDTKETTTTSDISLSDIKDRFSSLNQNDRRNILEFVIEHTNEDMICEAIVSMKLSREGLNIAGRIRNML